MFKRSLKTSPSYLDWRRPALGIYLHDTNELSSPAFLSSELY